MADEISAAASLAVSNGNVVWTKSITAKKFDQTTAGGPAGGAKSIGTTEESVSVSADLTSEGWCLITNDDSTNFVQIGFSVGVYGIKLAAGEFALFRVNPGATFYCKADTAACQVTFNVLDA